MSEPIGTRRKVKEKGALLRTIFQPKGGVGEMEYK
jgi:hypothetical protein